MYNYFLKSVQDTVSIAHIGCPASPDHGFEGGFDVALNSYHFDDLARLGYTYAEDICLLCGQTQSFIFKSDQHKTTWDL